jgi:nucleotide-binding universal stress UspA family protein
VIAVSPNPYEEIVAAAEKYGCDLIMMASHGRSGLSKLLMGSETQSVLSHTTLPVLVLR